MADAIPQDLGEGAWQFRRKSSKLHYSCAMFLCDFFDFFHVQPAVESNPKFFYVRVGHVFNLFDSIQEPEFTQPPLKVLYHQRKASISSRLDNLALKTERSDVCNYNFVVVVSYAGGEVKAAGSSVCFLPNTTKHATQRP